MTARQYVQVGRILAQHIDHRQTRITDWVATQRTALTMQYLQMFPSELRRSAAATSPSELRRRAEDRASYLEQPLDALRRDLEMIDTVRRRTAHYERRLTAYQLQQETDCMTLRGLSVLLMGRERAPDDRSQYT